MDPTPPSFLLPSALTDVESIVGNLSSDDAHAILDSVISRANGFRRAVETLRNAHAKISRLPREVLSTILVMAVEPASHGSAPTSWGKHVRVTAVCTHWRSVALQTPAFWACVPLLPCKKLPEMLARSKAHPRSVRLRICRSIEGWEKMEPHLPVLLNPRRQVDFHLVEEKKKIPYTFLHFPGHPKTFTQTVLDQFPTIELPLLQSLIISFRVMTPLPSHVLTAPKPCLRHLSLNSVEVDWEVLNNTRTSQITNLLSLDLTNIRPTVPTTVLHRIISSSPNLQRLKITPSLPDHTDFLNPQKVALESLEWCELVDLRVEHMLGLLHWLQAPRYGSTWTIKTGPPYHQDTPFEETDAIRVRSLLTSLGVASTDTDIDTTHPPYHELAITYDDESGRGSLFFKMALWSPPENFLSVTLAKSAFQTAIEALDLPMITSLTIAVEDISAPHDAWFHFFERVPHLRTLRITSHRDRLSRMYDRGGSMSAHHYLLEAALGPSPRIIQQRRSPFLLQQLDTLQMEYMHNHFSNSLSGALRLRHTVGFTLKQMTIVNCRGFDKEFVTQVKATGTNVEWDGTNWIDGKDVIVVDSDSE